MNRLLRCALGRTWLSDSASPDDACPICGAPAVVVEEVDDTIASDEPPPV
jgi:hypothetical protein